MPGDYTFSDICTYRKCVNSFECIVERASHYKLKSISSTYAGTSSLVAFVCSIGRLHGALRIGLNADFDRVA